MKCKVRLSLSVEMVVKGKSEEEIQDWLNSTSPLEIVDTNIPHDESYDEKILHYVHDDVQEDYVIESEKFTKTPEGIMELCE